MAISAPAILITKAVGTSVRDIGCKEISQYLTELFEADSFVSFVERGSIKEQEGVDAIMLSFEFKCFARETMFSNILYLIDKSHFLSERWSDTLGFWLERAVNRLEW